MGLAQGTEGAGSEAAVESPWVAVLVAVPDAALGDLADLLDGVVVGRDPGIVGPTAPRAEAAPDLAQGPVAQEIAVEVDLVVAGLCVVDPYLVLWECLHGASLATGVAHFVSQGKGQRADGGHAPRRLTYQGRSLSRQRWRSGADDPRQPLIAGDHLP